MNIKERANKLKMDIPILYLALKDKQTPRRAKLLALITVCYALSPIDLIPDFIPFFGYLDDLILLPILITFTRKCIPDAVYNRNKENAEMLWKDGLPKKMRYAIPIFIVWGFVLLLFMKFLFTL